MLINAILFTEISIYNIEYIFIYTSTWVPIKCIISIIILYYNKCEIEYIFPKTIIQSSISVYTNILSITIFCKNFKYSAQMINKFLTIINTLIN